mgnify:FL=1
MNVFAAIAVLALLIVVHEAGHFFAATLQGIRVNGFSIGFGPALIKRQRRGVTYAIRLLPLGGFVSFPDDDDDGSIPADDPDLMRNRPIPQRALVISAGVLANLLLALLVLFGQTAWIGLPAEPDPGVLIIDVQRGGAADLAGLQPGDKILAIDGQQLGTGQAGVQAMVQEIKAAPGETLTINRQRGNNEQSISLQPLDEGGAGRIGAQLQANISGRSRPANGPIEVVTHTASEFRQLLQQTLMGYGGLIRDFRGNAGQLSGPVKIVEMGAQLSEQGGSGLVLFMALISINLAVLNAFPVPLLDGGQMFLLILEGIRGRPVPERWQLAYLQSGFLLIVGLTLVLIVRDTSQLPLVQQLIAR